MLPLFLAGMRSSSKEVRAAVLHAAIRRRDLTTHNQLIQHYSDLDPADQAALCDAHRTMSHHAAPALRKAVLEGDAALCGNACEMILAAADYELFPTLIRAAENIQHRHVAAVLTTISSLVGRLHQDLDHWAGGVRPDAHDPSFVRQRVLNALERSLQNYAQHQRIEILNAFLLLTAIDNSTFLKILRDSQHACHIAMIAALSTSHDSGIMERLVDLLRDTAAPTAALRVVAERHDQQFLNIVLHELRHPAPLRVLHNMKRLQHVAWLESHHELLLEVDGRAQALAVELAAASGIGRGALFALLAFLLRNGLAEGRRASCQALAHFEDQDADELILTALDDPDASVQAAATRQLRPRRLPDALKRLVGFLDSPSVEVRNAAQTSLAEFNFIRFRSMFDLLDDGAARTTGMLVHKIDGSACQKLQDELNSPSVSTRLRGIEMAVAMAATDDVQPQLIGLAQHENAAVRKEAVVALGHCTSADSEIVLTLASRDPNGNVAEAARQILAQRRHKHAASLKKPLVAAGRTK